MDGTAVKSAFALLSVTFGESNKAYAPYPALITPEQGERRVIEENDQFYDRERFCQP